MSQEPLPWYTVAVSFVRTPPSIQKALKFSRQKRCTLNAIAGLPPHVGRQLEAAGVSWRTWQRVAHADGAAAQTARAAEELKERAEREQQKQTKPTRRGDQRASNRLLARGPMYRPLAVTDREQEDEPAAA
jgi:hypothetical protein